MDTPGPRAKDTYDIKDTSQSTPRPIGCEDIQALSQLIRPSGCTHLKRLEIGGESMSPDCVELMMRTLFSPSSLETLTVTRTDLTSSRNCFPPLEENSNLSLLFISCQIGSQSTSLARALQTNHTIENLRIDSLMVPVSYQIGPEGAVALESNKSLELLFNRRGWSQCSGERTPIQPDPNKARPTSRLFP